MKEEREQKENRGKALIRIDGSGYKRQEKADGENGEKRKELMLRKMPYVIMSVTLLIALLTFLSVFFSDEPTPEHSASVGEESEVTQKGPDESKTVIESLEVVEAMSVSDVYNDCKSSVVSVSAKISGGISIGSGFIIRDDGYIATAAHVISGAESVSIIFDDKSSSEASVVWSDTFCDIALLKVERGGLSEVRFGDSDKLLTGDRVLTIGTPVSLEYSGTLTSGEISYRDRVVSIYGSGGELEKKMHLIQTTAPVNSGNSGCPLFNMQGEVIGMITMKLGNEYSGIGFAINSKGLEEILSTLLKGEDVGYDLLSLVAEAPANLGVLGSDIAKDGVVGILIEDFKNGECSAFKMLKKGDVITEIAGESITGFSSAEDILKERYPGESVGVTVFRGGQYLTFFVELF